MDKILIIPVFVRNKQHMLWENNNHWKFALNKYITSEDKQKFIIPTGDLDDISLINYDLIGEGNFNQFETILDKYHAQEVLIATAHYFIDSNTNTPLLKLSLKTLNSHDNSLREEILSNNDNNSLQFLLQEAVKKITAPNISVNNSTQELIDIKITNVIINVDINNLREWLDIKRKLTEIKKIKTMTIKELSTQNVIVDINFQGEMTELLSELKSSGIIINQKNNKIIISL